MNQGSQVSSTMSLSKSRRLKALIIFLVILGGLMAWDYLVLRNHRESLARLKQAFERASTVQTPLRREEVSALLVGSPVKQSDSGSETNFDYFTWRGLIHNFHVCVESNAAGEVVNVEDSELPASSSIADGIPSTIKTVHSRVSAAEVDAACARAEQFYRQSGITREFQEILRDVHDGLPEYKISTVRGDLVWNSFRLSRQARRLFAFRFEIPMGQSSELDYVRWGSWAESSGIIPLDSESQQEEFESWRHWDTTVNVKIDGVELPDKNYVGFGSRSLKYYKNTTRFIIWFYMEDYGNPSIPFEIKEVMFISKAGAAPLRLGAHEVSEFIGMRTNIRRHPPTPDGVRAALDELNEQFDRGVSPATIPRILRPVKNALPEITVSTMPGQSRWHKLELQQPAITAARVRIPESMPKKVMLYGAILCTHPGEFGWDLTALGEFSARTLVDASGPDIALPLPNRLTLFSFHQELEPGQEFVLWYRTRDSQQTPGSVFVTLSTLPPDEKNEPGYPIVSAMMPWSCGKLLGVTVPPPAAPNGCTVFGIHEQPMARLLFTPDNRHLLSVDGFGFVRIWNVESQQLVGRFTLPYGTAEFATAGFDSETIWGVDNQRTYTHQWSLDTQEPRPAAPVPLKENEHLRVLTFGAEPNRLVALLSYTGPGPTFLEHPRFTVFDFSSNQWSEFPESVLGHIQSLIYLPALKGFASDMIRYPTDSEGKIRVVSSLLIWSSDFSRPIQELELGNFPVNYQGEEVNPIQLSASLDGRRLAAICKRGNLKVWNVANWEEVLSAFTPNSLFDVSLSHDGETVATTESDNNAVSLRRISDGQHTSEWQADETPITHVTHSSDGKWVATANTDGVIRLWKTSP